MKNNTRRKTTTINENQSEGIVIPFDRLPVVKFFDSPPKKSPYHTQRAEQMRQTAIVKIPRGHLDAAIFALNVKGKFGWHKDGYKGVFEHNCLTLAAAQTYAELGLKIIDLHGIQEDGKQTGPSQSCKIPRGASWEKRTTTDSVIITKFWTGEGTYPADKKGEVYDYAKRHQPRNVGIVLSPETLVLDIDGQIGEASLAALLKEHGPLPKTWTCNTGSGGQHLYFSYPDEFDIRNSASAIAPNIDIRANGGFVVAPPSVHPTGNFYAWEEGCAPWECEIEEAPKWLVKAAFEATKSRSKQKKKSKKKKTTHEENTGSKGFKAHLKTIGDGDGHKGFDTPIYKAACAWFGKNGSDADSAPLKVATS